jgi:hypothetical protein
VSDDKEGPPKKNGESSTDDKKNDVTSSWQLEAGKRAPVWKYFKLEDPKDPKSDGVCNSCATIVKRNNNTSNLTAHLKSTHKPFYAALMQSSKKKKRKLAESRADEGSPQKKTSFESAADVELV